MISRTITVIMTFVFVKSINDLYLYCLLYAISPVISGMLGMIFACKTFNIRLVEVNLNEIASELKSGWYVFTTQLSSKVFGAIGITLLGLFATNEEVGIYSAIQKNSKYTYFSMDSYHTSTLSNFKSEIQRII